MSGGWGKQRWWTTRSRRFEVMVSRRLEKIDRLVQVAVSEVLPKLSDPRISGLVTVTRVQTSPDLRTSMVYLSVMGVEPTQEALTLRAIQHAHGFIQGHLADRMATKVCPSLRFQLDASFKERMRTMEILEDISAQQHTAEEETDDEEASEETDE